MSGLGNPLFYNLSKYISSFKLVLVLLGYLFCFIAEMYSECGRIVVAILSEVLV
jgi:hypothetical protein